MTKPILISGIQPTGRLHLGNYLGALKNFVNLQNSGKYRCYFFIADLHALTENPDPRELKNNIVNLAADFLAAGLNPKKSIIFQQSQIKALTELKLILGPLTPISELMRMTAFKEKVLQALKPEEREKLTKEEFEKIIEGTNFGLAEYPILMAADILIFDGEFVPVGHDQLQHLEFIRTLVRKFNKKLEKVFIEPKAILTAAPRIMSLDEPTKKMSKSRPRGCIFIDDEPKVIEEKIRSAVTDSGNKIKYDPQNKPAVSNLILIYSELTKKNYSSRTPNSRSEHISNGHAERSEKSIKSIEKQFRGKGYADFKKSLAKVVGDYFVPFRKQKAALLKKPAALKKALRRGSGLANKIADKKIVEVKQKIGLI